VLLSFGSKSRIECIAREGRTRNNLVSLSIRSIYNANVFLDCIGENRILGDLGNKFDHRLGNCRVVGM
jgi:hypothetical protein